MSTSSRRHAPKGPIQQRDTDPMAPVNPMGTHICTAQSKTSGKRCGRPAIHGGTVCRYHGGNAPQVKAKAMERLIALQHPAIDRMTKLIDQEEFPTVAYAASRDVLDRTLGKPKETADLHVTGTVSVVDILRQRQQRHARKD